MEILRGDWMVPTAKIFKEKFEAKLELLEGWVGFKVRNHLLGEVRIFSGITQFDSL